MTKPLSALFLLVLPVAAAAQPAPKAPTLSELNKRAIDVLRELHDRGADLYNAGDALGAVRVYQTALATVSPFVVHHPAIQKLIADELAEVEKLDGNKAKAFRLHEVIEQVRTDLRLQVKKLEAETKPPEVTPVPKESTPKEPPKVYNPVTQFLSGVVTLSGKPLPGGEVTLVSLTLPEPRVFTTKTGDTGAYAFPVLPAAEYMMIVTGAGVPAKYQTTDSSGLRLKVTGAGGVLDIKLQ